MPAPDCHGCDICARCDAALEQAEQARDELQAALDDLDAYHRAQGASYVQAAEQARDKAQAEAEELRAAAEFVRQVDRPEHVGDMGSALDRLYLALAQPPSTHSPDEEEASGG